MKADVTAALLCSPARARLMPARRWLAALVCAGGLSSSIAAAAPPQRRAPPRAPRGDAWIIGSSSVAQSFGPLIERELEDKGYRVRRKAFSSAGLSRPDFRDMYRVVESLPINADTAAVFVYLGVNDAQALWLRPPERVRPGHAFLPWRDPRWSGIYRERARRLLERICQRGARRALFVLPVDVKGARLQRRLERIRKLQEQAAARTSCGVALPTTGDAASFDRTAPPVRHRDGFHMTAHGARVVWERIRPQAWRALRDRGDERRERRVASSERRAPPAQRARAELRVSEAAPEHHAQPRLDEPRRVEPRAGGSRRAPGETRTSVELRRAMKQLVADLLLGRAPD